MSNHLIIGLGGTGGKVIRSIRKAIYRDWRKPVSAGSMAGSGLDKVAAATPPGIKIDYLYLDSSNEHMSFDDETWKVLGENLQLNPSSQIELKGANIATIFKDIDSYPDIAPWIGPVKDWGSIVNLGGGGAKVLGGQKRRLGRLLFAMHASDFKSKLSEKVKLLRERSSNNNIHFHVVCGLAGGTGSGTLIDVISMIRNEFGDSQGSAIIPYLLLPEELPHNGWNSGNYHANGYAALMELNALAVGAYRPYNLLGDGKRFGDGKRSGDGERVEKFSSPFKICYLISNTNEQSRAFNVDKDIPELIAEMIYQKIVAAKTGVSRDVDRVTEMENRVAEHEGFEGKPERCWNFTTFGIKKIAYPEDEIRDYVGYALAGQTIRKMLYNNWAHGYLNETSQLAVEGYVADDKVRADLNLDRPVFFLERRFSFDDQDADQQDWKSIEAEWGGYIMRVAEDVRGEEGNWLDLLRRRCEDREGNKYRSSRGVAAYYTWKTDLINQYARTLADGVDEKLAQDLFDGKRSLVEIESILRSLCKVIENDMIDWSKWVDKQQAIAASKRSVWTENLQRFGDLGKIARMMPGVMDRILDAGRDAMIDYYIATTYVRAWPFAERLMRAVRAEIGRLADRAGKAVASFKLAEEKCADHAENHKPVDTGKQSSDVLLRLYNGDEVTRYCSAIIGSQKAQDTQSRQAQDRMRSELMSGRSSLRAIPVDKNRELLDIFAQAAHDTLIAFDGRNDNQEAGYDQDLPELNRLLNVSIIDKLEDRYAGNIEQMHSEIRDHMANAACMLKFNTVERNRKGLGFGGTGSNNSMIRTTIFMLPECEREREFAKELRKAFESAASEGSVNKQFIDTFEKRPHEITILSFVQLFPLRFLELLSVLRDHYDGRMQAGAQSFVMHTEDASYPDLFVRPLEKVVGPSLLLALALGCVRPKERAGASSATSDILSVHDEDNAPKYDLDLDFKRSISRAGEENTYNKIRSENLRLAKLRLNEGVKSDTITQRLKDLARDIAAGDGDELRKMIDFAFEASEEYKQLLEVARKSPDQNH